MNQAYECSIITRDERFLLIASIPGKTDREDPKSFISLKDLKATSPLRPYLAKETYHKEWQCTFIEFGKPFYIAGPSATIVNTSRGTFLAFNADKVTKPYASMKALQKAVPALVALPEAEVVEEVE